MYAFEITIDDIQLILDRHNIEVSDEVAQSYLDDLDFDAIEKARYTVMILMIKQYTPMRKSNVS